MEIPFPIGMTIICIVLFLVWIFYQRKIQPIDAMPKIKNPIPNEGFEVPVLAAFTGIKRLPRQASHSHNNINPLLVLFEDRLECKVLLKRGILYHDVEKIDIWNTIGTRNLQVYVKGKEFIFTANLYRHKNLSKILSFLKIRGVPLTDRAESFLLTYST